MANKGVGNTALGAAICRLIEQYEPQATRLFVDPVVGYLVGAPFQTLMNIPLMRRFTLKQTNALTPGIYGAQVCRTRYIDDAVNTALLDRNQQADPSTPLNQLVILGAGFDTRAYRLPGLQSIQVIEVDLPSVQAEKKKKLVRHFGSLPANVTFLPIDFDTQTLDDIFATLPVASVFDPTRPALFIWEGVTQYIAAESVRQTLAFIGKSAPGSQIIFTYILKRVIEGRSGIPALDKRLEYFAKNNAPWLFGIEPEEIDAFLKPYHLRLLADVGSVDHQRSYLQPLKRDLAVSEIERIATAVVAAP